jgi:hypothetical protein
MKPTWDKLDEYPSSEENTFHYAWGNLDSLLWTYFNPNKKRIIWLQELHSLSTRPKNPIRMTFSGIQ